MSSMQILAAFDYSIFPPINAGLNALSTVLLVTGFLLIRKGHREAHQKVMVGALVTSAVFLACYLFYHYGAGHTEFPKEYPVARRVYLAILLPHIVLAVVNLPFIIMLVVAAFRGSFDKHKRIARWLFPSWLFVAVTGVVIYFMIYQWFVPVATGAPADPDIGARVPQRAGVAALEVAGKPTEGAAGPVRVGDLEFSPRLQEVKADSGNPRLEVRFVVKNHGAVDRKLDRIESGCVCLSVGASENPVKAGGESVITGVFDTSKLRGATERSIKVTVAQAADPVELVTRILVDPDYEVGPSMTRWEIDGEADTRVVRFVTLRSRPIHVLKATSNREEVKPELVEVKPGQEYEVRLTPGATDKKLLGVVRLETDLGVEGKDTPLVFFSVQ